jgi:hypothetical protein
LGELVILLFPRMTAIMLDTIKMAVAQTSELPNATIEYNFELPKHKDIKADSFFGVKALYNPKVGEGKYNIIYKYQ